MRSRAWIWGLLWLAVLPLLACGTPVTAAPAVAPQSSPTAAARMTPDPDPETTAMPVPSPPPTQAPTPVPPPPPQFQPERFTGLAPGTYPVHLHAICSGRQAYHVAYLPNLAISAAGSGAIEVPSGYFGKGWCVVVYANRAATAVAAYRPI